MDDINHEQAADLLDWAIEELRELDEAARSLIAGFAPWDSDEVQKVKDLEALADAHREAADDDSS